MLFEIGPTFIDLVSVLVVFYLKFGLSVAVMIIGLVILLVSPYIDRSPCPKILHPS